MSIIFLSISGNAHADDGTVKLVKIKVNGGGKGEKRRFDLIKFLNFYLASIFFGQQQPRKENAVIEISGVSYRQANTLLIIFYFFFKLLPAIIAGVSIYLCYRLFILGVTGKASLSVESDRVSGQLINAAPELFFSVGGIVALIIIIWKGVKIKITGVKGERNGAIS
jgi:hypothetical protein